jgi:hypothetical protein
MKPIAALLAISVLLVACGSEPRARPRAASPAASPTSGASDRTVEIYAAVVRRLVIRDNTFGGGSSPFDHLFIVDGAIPNAGDAMNGEQTPVRPFPDEVKRGLEDALADLPEIDFVADADSVRLGPNGLDGVEDNGVIIALAPIEGSGDKVKVQNSLWCGGLCGQWLTYIVEFEGEKWTVTGHTGPWAIS